MSKTNAGESAELLLEAIDWATGSAVEGGVTVHEMKVHKIVLAHTARAARRGGPIRTGAGSRTQCLWITGTRPRRHVAVVLLGG